MMKKMYVQKAQQSICVQQRVERESSTPTQNENRGDGRVFPMNLFVGSSIIILNVPRSLKFYFFHLPQNIYTHAFFLLCFVLVEHFSVVLNLMYKKKQNHSPLSCIQLSNSIDRIRFMFVFYIRSFSLSAQSVVRLYMVHVKENKQLAATIVCVYQMYCPLHRCS